jgi:hypothetical protein
MKTETSIDCPEPEELSKFIFSLCDDEEMEERIIDHMRICKECSNLVEFT